LSRSLNISAVFFIGIGGSGMSSLARYCLQNNVTISGYDKIRNTECVDLETQGVVIHYNLSCTAEIEQLGSHTIVVYSAAIGVEHPLLKSAVRKGLKTCKRAVFLAQLVNKTKCFAIAGTHGKTTTTALLSHIFAANKLPFTAFIGGYSHDLKSNFYQAGNDYTIVEADEYDKSFLNLKPYAAAITSVDADHLDCYADHQDLISHYRQFYESVEQFTIVHNDIPFGELCYGVNSDADFHIGELHITSESFSFELRVNQNQLLEVEFNKPGRHNIDNTVAAIALAHQVLPFEKIIPHIKSFEGVRRRFDIIIQSKQLLFIDDYGHHPTAIEAIHQTLCEFYPNRKKTILFQPHLFSRTSDFMAEFASALSLFDEIYLLPIYAAREIPIAEVSSEVLAQKITKPIRVISKTEALEVLPSQDLGLLITMGAGDISELVEPLKDKLCQTVFV
tara:strand:+ start:22011 stop:23354 length:1344 start_codon:yes stop_codon:yes gene_type:complete